MTQDMLYQCKMCLDVGGHHFQQLL